MKKLIIIASTMLAFGVAAQSQGDTQPVPVLTLCRGGKLVGLQLLATIPGVYTIAVAPDACAPPKPEAPKQAPKPRPPASYPT
jgi:hypothetical protein